MFDASYLAVFRLRFRLFFSTRAAVSLVDFLVDFAAFGVIFFSAIWLTSSDRSGPAGLDIWKPPRIIAGSRRPGMCRPSRFAT